MREEAIIGTQERDPVDLWLFIINNTAILAILINILSIQSGVYDVASLLLFIPIVIAAYWHPGKGLIFAIVLSVVYLGMVWFLQAGRTDLMGAEVIKSIVLVGVAAVVSSLSGHKQKSEVKYLGLFRYSAAGICVVDRRNHTIQEANARFAGILGYLDKEVRTIQFKDLWVSQAKKE
jgi:PAS domain-containing protein